MISFLFGENHYQTRQELETIVGAFETKLAIERYDGEEVSSSGIDDMCAGPSLFAPQKLVIVEGLSRNKDGWALLGEKLENIPDETHLVIVEELPDKRTKTFKQLQKKAQVIETKSFTESQAIAWVQKEAKKRNIKLDHTLAKLLIDRVGLDQWQLHFALEKLRGLETATPQHIEDSTEATIESNIFSMVDAVVTKQPTKARTLMESLRMTEDAHLFFGLLAGQLFQLITLAVSHKSANEVAGDLKAHPYPLQKVERYARQLTKSEIKTIATYLGECDDRLKRSGMAPWVVVEQAIVKIASR